MNSKIAKEIRKFIKEKYPQFFDERKENVLSDFKSKHKALYKEIKRQYKMTPHNQKNRVIIK